MEPTNHFSLLEMIEHPAFCVQDGIIIRANKAARYKLFEENKAVTDYLPDNGADYAAFSGGCLYLNITSACVTCGASVTRIDDFDLFVLDTEGQKLEAYALASLQLKVPLCNIVAVLETILAEDKTFHAQAGNLRQNVYQLSRVVNNMADASWLRLDSTANFEQTDFRALFQEIMEKMEQLTHAAGYTLEFTNLTESVAALADRDLLLRAVSNIVSNAIKFSPSGSLIRASLTKKDEFVFFSVSDPGDEQAARCNVFTRYMRPAVLEDIRYGLGLGMEIIHSVAADHGGTVLVDTPQEGGTRVTMSLSLRNRGNFLLKTPITLPGNNYVAGLDAGLVEFADVLPPNAFQNLNP